MAETSAAAAGTIRLGDVTVNRLGLGTNRVTDTPEARALLRRAVELGVNFIDTAYRYAGGESEVTIGNTLAPYNGEVVAHKKAGGKIRRSPNCDLSWRRACAACGPTMLISTSYTVSIRMCLSNEASAS